MSYTLYIENGAQRKALILSFADETSESHEPNDNVRGAHDGGTIVLQREKAPSRVSSKCAVNTLAVFSPSGTALLSVPAVSYMVSNQGYDADCRVALASVADGENGDLNVTYAPLADGDKMPEPECKASQIRLLDGRNGWKQIYDYGQNRRYRRVNICFDEHRAAVGVQIMPPEQVYRIVLDFGSEASQVLVQRYNAGVASSPMKLFETIAKEFFYITPTNKPVFDQQDADPTLFRSRFFTQNKFEEEYVLNVPSNSDTALRVLTRRDDPKKGKRIANVKVSFLSGVYNHSSVTYRGIIMRLLHAAMRTVHNEVQGKSVAIELNLLLPNVMDQQSVASLVKAISRDCNDTRFTNQFGGLDVALFDITAYSESDASLLEWLHRQQPVKPGKYLIIDGGKGTIDFSIAEVTDGSHITPIYRNGFLGAGNAVNYAIFQYLMDRIGGAYGPQLEQRMLKAEPAKRYILERLIERYKRRYNPDKKNLRNYLQPNPEQLSPEKILDLIVDMIDKGDFGADNEIINRMVVRIAHTTCIDLRQQQFDHVVFAGRAFMFEPLRKMVETFLKQINPNVVVHEYKKDTAKRGCLYGPLCPITAGMQTMLVGQVKTISSAEKLPTINLSLQDIDDIEREPKRWLQRVNSFSNKSMNLFQKIRMTINDFFKSDDENDENHEVEVTADPPVAYIATIDVAALLGRGQEQKTYGSNTRILISGRQYVTDFDAATMKENVEYRFRFDGERFVLRAPDRTIGLMPSASHLNSNEFIDASLFPYQNDYN